MRKNETDQLYSEGCVPDPDSLLANQVRMFFGDLPRKAGVNYHDGLAPELGTLGDVLRMLDHRLEDAIFKESSARTANDWCAYGDLPGIQETWKRAKAEVEEIEELIAAAKIGLRTRLLRGG